MISYLENLAIGYNRLRKRNRLNRRHGLQEFGLLSHRVGGMDKTRGGLTLTVPKLKHIIKIPLDICVC